MKRIFFLLGLALAIASPVALTTGCSTAPTERTTAVLTLKAVGASAKATVALSAQLYRDHRITAEQANKVADFYDQKWQPAFNVAVTAVQSNLNSIASTDLIVLASELSNLVISFQSSTP